MSTHNGRGNGQDPASGAGSTDGSSSAAPGNPTGMVRGLDEILKETGETGVPPVEKWNPPYCGDLDIRIARDGTWYYLGSPIGRKPLVKLFSSVIRLDEDGRYYLVTPVEKIGIIVEDKPFVAVEAHVTGSGKDQRITFRSNVDDLFEASDAHPIRMEIAEGTDEPAPYILVRRNLEALIARSVFYDLVNLGVEEEVDGTTYFGVWSAGRFFPLATADHVFQDA